MRRAPERCKQPRKRSLGPRQAAATANTPMPVSSSTCKPSGFVAVRSRLPPGGEVSDGGRWAAYERSRESELACPVVRHCKCALPRYFDGALVTPGERALADQLALRERIRAKHAPHIAARPTGGGRTVPTLDARARERVKGHAKVPYDALKRKLGTSAFGVWLTLLRFRTKDGVTTIDGARLAYHAQLPLETTRDALRKLRKAGLVSLVTWKLRHGAKAGKAHARTHAPVRKVYGELPAVRGIAYATVPEETLRWFEAPERRGGKRAGAGHPKGLKNKPRNQNSKPTTPLLLQNSNPTNPKFKTHQGSDLLDLSTSSSLSKERETARSRPARLLSLSERDGSGMGPELEPPIPHAVPSAPASPASSIPAMPSAPEPLALAHVPSAQKVPLTIDVLNAARERVRPAPQPELPDVSDEAWRALPSLRLSVASFAPSVPSPPKLDPDDPIERQVFLLAEWYRGAVHAKYGVRPFLGRGPLTPTSKHWKTLARIAPLFVEHDIAPAAWVAVSLGLYEEHARKLIEEKASAKKGRKKKRVSFPALGWVYSMSRMTASRWQYRQHGGDFQGSTVQYTPACRALMVGLQRLRDLVDFERPQTAEHARRLVDQAFPDEGHDELLARAKAESRAAQADILHGVACGRWMWLL